MALHENARDVAPRVRYEWDMLHWAARELARLDEETAEFVEHDDECFEEPLLHLTSSDIEFPTVDNVDGNFGCWIANEGGSSGRGEPYWNAVLESFLMHSRVLYHFFTRTRCKKDDVIASDFFEDSEAWEQLDECESRWETSQRINKALAHLTYKRIDYEKSKSWMISAIYRDLLLMWETFWTQLPDSRRMWFRSDLNDNAG